MRSIETIVRECPNLTGKEILEVQEQEKLEDQKAYEKHNEKKLAFIKDINENGGYYRGRFGLDQHWFYRVFNMEMNNDGNITMDVEKIVLFFNDTDNKHQVTKPNEIKLERRIDPYCNLDQYGLDDRERVTVKEWDEVNDYLNKINQFWSMIEWKM